MAEPVSLDFCVDQSSTCIQFIMYANQQQLTVISRNVTHFPNKETVAREETKSVPHIIFELL